MNYKAGARKMYYNMYVHLESMSGSYRKSVYDRVFSQTAKIQQVTNSVFFLSAVCLYQKIKYGRDNIDRSEI